jgi:hypothetical protein
MRVMRYRLTEKDVSMLAAADAKALAERGASNAVKVARIRQQIADDFGEPGGQLVDELAEAARASREAIRNGSSVETTQAALARLLIVNQTLRQVVAYVRYYDGDGAEIVRPLSESWRRADDPDLDPATDPN